MNSSSDDDGDDDDDDDDVAVVNHVVTIVAFGGYYYYVSISVGKGKKLFCVQKGGRRRCRCVMIKHHGSRRVPSQSDPVYVVARTWYFVGPRH